ncbi:MAG: cysteine hydrolase family protein [Pseudobdellovibrionaceae bacterium]
MKIDTDKDNSQALLLIDVQKGFQDPTFWGKRNNPALEQNISDLLTLFRSRGQTVIHVQHHSTEMASPLRPDQIGVEFMDFASPKDEPVFIKQVNSAFIGTNLETFLKEKCIKQLILAGFTSDHCVSTTARMASNLGFNVFIPYEAVATFDRIGYDGNIYPAELVHNVNLSSLHGEFAQVISLKAL